MRRIRGLIIALATTALLPVMSDAYAKKTKTKVEAPAKTPAPVKKTAYKPKPGPTPHERFVKLKRDFRNGDVSKRSMWEQLTLLNEQGLKLPMDDRVALLSSQATMLSEGGYPVLAAIYASQAVKTAERPLMRELEPSWGILRRVSEKRPINNLLDVVADKVDLQGRPAPAFGTDWNYFAANAAARKGDTNAAVSLYASLRMQDRYFFSGKYQQAMLHVEKDELDKAIVALKAMVYPGSHRMSPLEEETRDELTDYAMLALGRIYYEKGRFPDAIKAYRAVNRDGPNFYDALFEQSWAFFMAGYPAHALGALHGAESPFYDKVFQPEAPVLRALVHYWLCRYDDSRNALADFTGKYGTSVEKLSEFLDRQRLEPEQAYLLFENLISGVSGESLGIPRSILETAAEKDNMMLVRDQYAAILEEIRRLETKGIYGARGLGAAKPMEYLERWAAALRIDIGKKYLAELQDMKKEYDRLYAQAEFLYVELLMSEKDQILGKELHASSKITKVSKKLKVNGWGNETQHWKDARNGEYWWDEVGWYITPVDSQCAVPAKGSVK